MAANNYFSFVAKLASISENMNQGILLSEGFSVSDPSLIESSDLWYLLYFRAVAGSADEAIEQIHLHLASLDLPVRFIERVEIPLNYRYTRAEKKFFGGIPEGGIQVKDFYIGFQKGNEEAERQATEIVVSSATCHRWSLWS